MPGRPRLRAGKLPLRKVADRFGLLTEESRGLAEEIARFVATGAPSGVILKLQGAGLRGVWAKRGRSYPLRDEGGLFTAMDVWRVDQMVRMGDSARRAGADCL